MGYVAPDSTGRWDTLPSNPANYDEDIIRVFQTFVLADSDTTLHLHPDGDDGHSVYVNDGFIGGGGFGAVIDFDLGLVSGVPVKLEVAVYNGPGPSAVEL